MRLWYRFCRFICSVVYHLLWWPRGEAKENVPDGPCIICANHRSWFDPPLIGVVLNKRELGYLAKAELFKNPLGGRLIYSVNARPVRRGAIDRVATKMILELLAGGVPIVAFPEGTRSRDGTMLPPRPGIGRLARQAGLPVVPAYIFGSQGIEKHPFGYGRLRVRFGNPITATEITAYGDNKDGYRAVSRLILERICDLGDDPARDRAQAFADDPPSEKPLG